MPRHLPPHQRTYLPPVGDVNSELTAFAGRIEERDLSVDLGWQGTYSLNSLCSRLYGGGSSYSMRLARATDAGGQKFYVPTLMGIFPGQRLKIDLIEEPLFTVKRLGQDADGLFFETWEKAPRRIEREKPLYNKHNVNVLSLSDTSNSDNQGATVNLNRRAYGAGDVFMMAAVLEYQSNVYSGLGDEGGVGSAVNLLHDIEPFHGVVESWTQKPGEQTEVVYKPTRDALPPDTRNTQKLGTSRPLINLNERKQKRDGAANVVPRSVDPAGWLAGLPAPDHLEGCILIRPVDIPADWKKYVGSFIALVGRPLGGGGTDASEHYAKDEETPAGRVSGEVYRWWYITHVQDAGSGRAYVFVDRVFQRAHEVAKSGPLLFRDENYTDDKSRIEERKLGYIIAPGAWVSDVRNGVAGNVLGNEGAQPADPRRILLAPGEPDFAENDPITNPPGPDVWHPSGFRARQFHHFPATSPGDAFLSENYGRVQVGSGLHVAGSVAPDPGESMPDALRRIQKDQQPHYQQGVWITATTDAAIRIQGYSKNAAIDLRQQQGDQKILWFNSDLTGFSTLHADRGSGEFLFATTLKKDAVAVLSGEKGIALTKLHGLSGTSTPARNLSGRQEVKKNEDRATVLLPVKEDDDRYRVFLQCSWLTESAVVTRSDTQFEVSFGTKPTEDTGFDWLLVR